MSKSVNTKEILNHFNPTHLTPVKAFNEYRKDVYSQCGEDGVIQELLRRLPAAPKYYVEFGGWDGYFLSNTANLRKNFGWDGVLFEGDKTKVDAAEKGLNIHHAFITSKNVNEIFQKHGVPEQIGLLSIDIDSDDVYVWEALDAKYKPAIVVIEYNPGLPCQIPLRIVEGRARVGAGYFNANLLDMYEIGLSKGYAFVTTVVGNAFFVRGDLFDKLGIAAVDRRAIPTIYDTDNTKEYWLGLIRNNNDIWITR